MKKENDAKSKGSQIVSSARLRAAEQVMQEKNFSVRLETLR